MNKMDPILRIQEEPGLPKTAAKAFADRFFDEIADTLAARDGIELQGFCSFHIKECDGYTGGILTRPSGPRCLQKSCRICRLGRG